MILTDRSVQRHSVTSLETARSLAKSTRRRSMYSAFPGNFSVSYLSFVYGRSLTAGKILFTGRQTCSLYLVLWLCASNVRGSSLCYQLWNKPLRLTSSLWQENILWSGALDGPLETPSFFIGDPHWKVSLPFISSSKQGWCKCIGLLHNIIKTMFWALFDHIISKGENHWNYSFA